MDNGEKAREELLAEIDSLKKRIFDMDLALMASEDRFVSIFNDSPIAIELYDAGGNLLRVNTSCLSLFGIRNFGEIRGFSLFADPNLRPEHKAKLAKGEMVRYQDAFHFDLVRESKLYETSREGIIWLDVLIMPIGGLKDTSMGYLVQIQDITEPRQSAMKLQEALVRAEASDRLKTAFLNNISHEVRTPLNGILGFIELIENPDLTAEDRQLYKDILHESSERLLNTINSYMDISLLVSGNMAVNRSDFDLLGVLNQGYQNFREQASAKGITIQMKYPDSTPDIILHSDQEMIRKVYFHLLANALKFTEFGTINVRYRILGEEIEVSVEDSGIGIREDIRERIFDSFLQADLSNTRRHEGSGLGLAIAKGIIELLGGNIWVKSTLGYGSTFGFSVPGLKISQPENVPQAGPSAVSGSDSPVILIAEDDPINIFLLESMLGKTKAVVWHVENGQLAVNFCKNHPELSLVLMDLKMPVMDGFEATRIIRTIRPELPVIAVTAYAMQGDRELALEAGCNEYLAKPFTAAGLLEKLKTFCEI